MAERKVLTKYYPPDFDPSALGRVKKSKHAGPQVSTVRLMAPCSMRCTSCGEYIYKGRKFNARKETPPDLKYLGIQMYRFYIRCTRCSAEIIFRTDPKNQDYTVESGAKRNTEAWRRGRDDELEESDEARLDRLEREMAEAAGEGGAGANGERNAMEELEAKTAEARREMAVADALDEIRSRNARIARAERDGTEVAVVSVAAPEEERLRQEREDEEAAKRAFAFAKKVEEGWEAMDVVEDGEDREDGTDGTEKGNVGASLASPPPRPAPAPAPSFKRQVKKKKDHSALLGIKKKVA